MTFLDIYIIIILSFLGKVFFMILGKIIRDLRENHNYTQKELAKALNITPACLSKYETGRSVPSYDTLSKIADIFNVSVDYLIGRNSVQYDFSILSKKIYKNTTILDIDNSIAQLDSVHMRLFIEILELLSFHNEHYKRNNKFM